MDKLTKRQKSLLKNLARGGGDFHHASTLAALKRRDLVAYKLVCGHICEVKITEAGMKLLAGANT